MSSRVLAKRPYLGEGEGVGLLVNEQERTRGMGGGGGKNSGILSELTF